MAFQASLVPPDPRVDLGQGRVERRVGVASGTVADQLLTRSQLYRAIDTEGKAILADHDLGGAAAIEVFANAQGDFV
jgi:hypothetical protein